MRSGSSRLRDMSTASALAFLVVAFLVASPAASDVIYRVEASGWRDGRAVEVDALRPGDLLVLDIVLRATEPLRALEASVVGFDPSIVRLDPDGSAVATDVLVASCSAEGACSGGLFNRAPSGSGLRQEPIGGVGTRIFFLAGWARDQQSEGDGSADPGAITGTLGDPQFRIAFRAETLGTTTLRVATDRRYENDSISIYGTPVRFFQEASVTVRVVPEPAAASLIGLGLCWLAKRSRTRSR